jgi:hypothetical protein
MKSVQVVFTLKNIPSVFTEVVQVKTGDVAEVKLAIKSLLSQLKISHSLHQVTSIVEIPSN